jgi:hypothetical protein
MTRDGSNVERFVRAVHRRMVLLRFLERVGLAVLAGCGLALLFLPVLLWRGEGERALQWVAGCWGLGVICGVLWGIARRPGRLWAAVEADRQLKLADLLGTALYLLRSRDSLDEMGRTVLATAEARCAALSPSAVILNKIGARGWGGIGLAVAMVLTVALVGAGDRAARAGSASSAAAAVRSWRDVDGSGAPENGTRLGGGPDLRRVRPGEGGDDEQGLGPALPPRAKGVVVDATKGASGETAGTDAGTGGGSARGGSDNQPGNRIDVAAGGIQTGGGGVTSSGGAGAAKGGTSGVDGGSTAGAGRRAATPVWKLDQWAADRAAALRAVDGGRVPDGYRELVREYFDR